MGKALYRKYRSKSLSEIVGQEHITSTLSNALNSGKISHAYLFTGPRGTGKTSIARILAHEINALPYTDDSTHMDIIEIDAASNRRIDEIRDLRERVHTAPTSAKFKVYIIDEVHMLTKEAFNALLKTLEEPPEHVIFVLATTEAHKLPETIVSRTQRFTFKTIEQAKVIEHLRHIAAQENIDISDEALELIAKAGGGSFRDSISLLDQARNASGHIGADEVRQTLGIAPNEALDTLLAALDSGSPSQIVTALSEIKQAGYQSGQLAKQLIQRLRDRIMHGEHTGASVALITSLLEVPLAHDIDTKLELVLLAHALGSSPGTNGSGAPKVAELHVAPAPTASAVALSSAAPAPKPASSTPAATTTTPKKEAAPAPPSEPSSTEIPQPTRPVNPDLAVVWQNTLDDVKQHYNTLYGIARMAEAEVTDAEVMLYFKFPFHQKRINEAKNKQIIIDTIKRVSGRELNVVCIVAKDREPGPSVSADNAQPATSANTSSPLDTISDIFGDAEVLNS